MKYSFILITLAAASTLSLRAEAPFEREFNQLREQRDKLIAAAAEPINRKYQVSLDQLLRRAMQGNDLDTALKIKQEMAGSAITAAPATIAKPESATHKAKTKKQWEDYLTNTVWKVTRTETNAPWGTMTFKDKGVVDFNKERKWTVANNGKIIVELYTLEFSNDMKTFKVVWGATGELTGALNSESK